MGKENEQRRESTERSKKLWENQRKGISESGHVMHVCLLGQMLPPNCSRPGLWERDVHIYQTACACTFSRDTNNCRMNEHSSEWSIEQKEERR